MSFQKKCGPCHGSGYYGLSPADLCKICGGIGELTLDGTKDDYKSCGPCRGSGYYGLTPTATCEVCHGVGLHRRVKPATDIKAKPDLIIWQLMHPEIVRVSKPRFESGHLADSVEAALKEVNDRVKKLCKGISGKEFDGADLMWKAFSLSNPILLLGDLSTGTGKDMQQGYMQMFAGAIIGIRNPKAHANITIDEPRAIHFLFLASLLMFKVDEAVPVAKTP